MTDAVETPVAEPSPASEEAPTAATRRGRPRPEATITRDKDVLEKIGAEGSTRDELVQATGLKEAQVYLSLYRLRKDGLVARSRSGSSHRWTRVDPNAVAAEPAPEPAPVA